MAYPYLKHAPSERIVQAITGPLGALIIGLCITTLCGAFVDPRGFALSLAIAALLLLGIVYPILAVRGLSGTVRFDASRREEGETVHVHVRILNRGWMPVWGLRLAGIAPTGTDPVGETEPDLPLTVPKGETEFSRELTGLLRGQYPSEPPRAICGFPFGLIHARCRLETRGELLVWPRRVSTPEVPEALREGMQEGAVESRRAGYEGDLLGTRDFRRGDSLRRVHWGQSARHERLIVVERHAMRSPSFRLFLDLTGADAGPESPREKAIRLAGSLAMEWERRGARISLTVRDRNTSHYAGPSRALRDALARLPLTPAPPIRADRPDGIENESVPVSLETLTVVVTTSASLPSNRGSLTLVADRETADTETFDACPVRKTRPRSVRGTTSSDGAVPRTGRVRIRHNDGRGVKQHV
ncbi:MAG: DUF58 domain-containing protein [Capsulimonadales bacterium]|nr:DUF58 domain-containing protein [Capsulimonadales bacterium]